MNYFKIVPDECIEFENKNAIDEYIDNYFFKNCAHNSPKQKLRDNVYKLF